MPFVIRFLKDLELPAGTETFSGSLEAATNFASEGLKKYDAETAAIMDAEDLQGTPKAMVSRHA